VDPIELLFEFYDVYLSVTEKQTNSHLNCLPIGPKHLQDFNEIRSLSIRSILCFVLLKRH
jgi:hypothetical protein